MFLVLPLYLLFLFCSTSLASYTGVKEASLSFPKEHLNQHSTLLQQKKGVQSIQLNRIEAATYLLYDEITFFSFQEPKSWFSGFISLNNTNNTSQAILWIRVLYQFKERNKGKRKKESNQHYSPRFEWHKIGACNKELKIEAQIEPDLQVDTKVAACQRLRISLLSKGQSNHYLLFFRKDPLGYLGKYKLQKTHKGGSSTEDSRHFFYPSIGVYTERFFAFLNGYKAVGIATLFACLILFLKKALPFLPSDVSLTIVKRSA